METGAAFGVPGPLGASLPSPGGGGRDRGEEDEKALMTLPRLTTETARERNRSSIARTVIRGVERQTQPRDTAPLPS